jgi:DNA-binding transcriptional regulator YdaS (Cro superfamily)
MDNNVFLVFVAVITAAFLVQAGVMVALYVVVRKSSTQMESLASEVKAKTVPMLESAQSLVSELRPKVEQIVENVAQSTSLVRAQMHRLDATVNDALDRTRLQVIRADEMVSRTLDKVEETTEAVHRTVVSPIRRASGLYHGVTAGLEYFLGRRRRGRDSVGVPQDELFI